MQSMRQGEPWPKRGRKTIDKAGAPSTSCRYRSRPMPSTTRVIIESALTLIIGLALLGALWVAAIVLVGE